MCARRRNYGSENSYTGKVICDETPFAVTEAFKTLRANLMFSSAGEDCPVFGTTSAYSDTGKSVITANAAVSFAYLDKKVLLIDGDMRKPVQHRIFGRENRHGLSELLSCGKSQDMAEVFEKSVIHGVVPGLDLIPCGKIPPNPSELMSSDNMRRLIEYAKEKYIEHIILDTLSVAAASHRFHEKAGFKRIESQELPVPYGFPDGDSLLFMLDI